MIARGDAVVAIQPVSHILNMPGVECAGTIPTELPHVTVYAAAIVVGSKESEASRRLIAFLSSDGATAAIKRSGMEPGGEEPGSDGGPICNTRIANSGEHADSSSEVCSGSAGQ